MMASSAPGRAEARPQVGIEGRRLVLRHDALFADEKSPARRLLALAFSLPEVQSATLREASGSIDFSLHKNAEPGQVWRRLGALLRAGAAPGHSRDIGAARLPLHSPVSGLPVRVTRFGQTLTTCQVRGHASGRLRIAHPLLAGGDTRFRALEALGAVHGVTSVRAVRLRSGIVIDYDRRSISPEQLLRFLDDSWGVLLHGVPAPELPRRLALTGTLLAFSATAQFIRNALLPWAAAAVLLYNLPNVIAALRDLRRRRVGSPAMHTLGFAFLLWFRLPFGSSLFSALAQTWPQLADRLAIGAEKRLFTPHRRRHVWARLHGQPGEIETDVGALRPGMIIAARAGEYVAADGIVVEGLAAVGESHVTGGREVADKLPGDPVYAGAYIGDGEIAIRVTRIGEATAAAQLSRALPRRPVGNLPSLAKVEDIGHRNARPALLAASIMLLATRAPRHSQVIIRPDYVTAPRLSAKLTALTAIAEALSGGALIKNPAALDRLLDADICVLDDGVDLSTRRVQLRETLSRNRDDADAALALAATAMRTGDTPRAAALQRALQRRRKIMPEGSDFRRLAGAIAFRDETGSEILVMSPAIALQNGLYVPKGAVTEQLRAEAATPAPDPASRSLAVARGRSILGLIRFERTGPLEAAQAIAALRLQFPDTRFVYLASAPQETAEALAEQLGLDAVFGGLKAAAKTEVMRSLSARAAWIGNGADPASAITRAAAAISISTGGIDALAHDPADILLLRGDLLALSAARLAAERRRGQLRADYRTVYVANLAAVAGGFAAGFGSLQAGITSNLGTAMVFLSRWRAVRNLVLRNERRAAEAIRPSAV